MIHRVVRRHFLRDGIVVAASLSHCWSIWGIYFELMHRFVLTFTFTFWWRSLANHLCFASDTFSLLSSNVFKNLAQCNRAPLPNNALNIKAQLKEGFPHTLLMLAEFSWRNYQQTKIFGEKNIDLIFLLFFGGSGKSHMVPKFAKAQVKCPGRAYGSKAFNLWPAFVN